MKNAQLLATQISQSNTTKTTKTSSFQRSNHSNDISEGQITPIPKDLSVQMLDQAAFWSPENVFKFTENLRIIKLARRDDVDFR